MRCLPIRRYYRKFITLSARQACRRDGGSAQARPARRHLPRAYPFRWELAAAIRAGVDICASCMAWGGEVAPRVLCGAAGWADIKKDLQRFRGAGRRT